MKRYIGLGRKHRGGRRARGSTVVEFAVVLPLLLTILFGIIEYGWIFSVRQTLQNAAREGCRLAVLKTTGEPYTNVIDRVTSMVEPIGVTPTIELSHAVPGNPIEVVTVSVPIAEVSLMGNFFGPRDYDLAGTCSMRKEGMDEG